MISLLCWLAMATSWQQQEESGLNTSDQSRVGHQEEEEEEEEEEG